MSLHERLKGSLPQVDINKLQRSIDKEVASVKDSLEKAVEAKLDILESKIENKVLQATIGVFEGKRGEKGEKGDVGPQGDSIKGSEGPMGPRGDKGEPGVGIKGERGAKGEDSVVSGPQGDRGIAGKDGSPDTGEEIVDKINAQKNQIDADRISGLPSGLTLRQRRGLKQIGGGGDILSVSDLTSQTDGSTKTFTIPAFRKVLLVLSPDAPIIYRPDTDYTVSGTTLTLTAQVDPPLSGQTLLIQYVV